jgi:osmotically-inducible protein OsmY
MGMQENSMMRRNAAALIVAAMMSTGLIAGCASTSTTQSTGQAIDDGVVTAKVKTKLIEDPLTKAHQISVETFKGSVQLSGFVDSTQARNRALQLAKQVEGVKEVKDAMEVRGSTG